MRTGNVKDFGEFNKRLCSRCNKKTNHVIGRFGKLTVVKCQECEMVTPVKFGFITSNYGLTKNDEND